MNKAKLLYLITLLLLVACASGPTIVSNTSPDTDFEAFETYNFMTPLGTDRSSGVSTPMSSMLMASMDREMAARGLTRAKSPDLLIDFNIFVEDRLDVRQTPTHSVHMNHWNRRYSTWPTYQTTVRQYTEGTLLIDLIDPKANRLIAEGSAQRRVSDNEFSQRQSDEVVGLVLNSVWTK
jgi:hypothetical protein